MLQLHVLNSPFNEEQVEQLNKLLPTLTESQKIWLTGYLAATQNQTAIHPNAPQTQSSENQAAPDANTAVEQVISKDVTILYGSQTGNAQHLAEHSGKTLTEKGFNCTILSMNDFKPKKFKKGRKFINSC